MKTGIVYLSVRSPEYIRRDMEEIADLGYTHVVHTLSESDFQYYQDTMVDIINLSTDLGLKVYVAPWGVGRFYGGEAFSELAARHPGLSQCTNLDRPVVASCPNHHIFRDYMKSWVDFVCGSQVETVLWYEPHLYDESDSEEGWSCRCETCQKLFRKRYGHLMPSSLTESVQDFRQKTHVEFLDELTQMVNERGKRNSVMFQFPGDRSGIQSWDAIAELPDVDEIGVGPYWSRGKQLAEIAKRYRRQSQKLLEIANRCGKEAQIWIKNFSIEKNAEQSVAEATFAAYNEGVRNIFALAFKGTRDLSALRSDNWQKVWATQTEAFAECHEKAIMNEMIKAMKY